MKLNFKNYTAVGIVFLIILVLGCFVFLRPRENSKCYSSSNVASIRVEGNLVTSMTHLTKDDASSSVVSSRDIVNAIEKADQNNHIKAILLEIDSNGGESSAGEEVVRALQHTHKPTVAYIRNTGLSAAYWIASATNWIIALETSDVGDIGVTQSFTDSSIQDTNNGITYNQLSTGKYKDMFAPDKPLTADERALIMKNLAQINEVLITDIAHNRKMDIQKIRNLADGSDVTADTALQDGLIDKIGDINTVKDYIKGLIHSNPKICEW